MVSDKGILTERTQSSYDLPLPKLLPCTLTAGPATDSAMKDRMNQTALTVFHDKRASFEAGDVAVSDEVCSK